MILWIHFTAIPTHVSGSGPTSGDANPVGDGADSHSSEQTAMEDEASARPKRKKRSEMTEEEKKVPT